MFDEIFKIENLAKLEVFLLKQDLKTIRKDLFSEFLKCAEYKNVSDWNKAVRLCECLAIVTWGDHEPVEAIRGVFYNGNPETGFFNKFREVRFVSAIWSKRKDGLTMEHGRTAYYPSPDVPSKKSVSTDKYPVVEDIQNKKLDSQRNWIPKTPILISRTISNCYKNSKSVIESVEKELQPALDRRMRPEKYGRAIQWIVFNCSYSYFDNDHCKNNYIIAEEKLKLKQKTFYPALLKMYSKKEIEKNGYYLRNRFEYGPFNTGTGKARTWIHFEKEFSDLNKMAQKQKIAEYVTTALKVNVEKLKKKKLNCDFESMVEDFEKISTEWKNKQIK